MKKKIFLFICLNAIMLHVGIKVAAQENDFTGIWKCKLIFHVSNLPFGKDEKYKCDLHVYKEGRKYLAVVVDDYGYNVSIGSKVMDNLIFDNSKIVANGTGRIEIVNLSLDINNNVIGSARFAGKLAQGELKLNKREPVDGQYSNLVKKYLTPDEPVIHDYAGVWKGYVSARIVGVGVNKTERSAFELYLVKIGELQYGACFVQSSKEWYAHAKVDKNGNLNFDRYPTERTKTKISIVELIDDTLKGKGEIDDYMVWNPGHAELQKQPGFIPNEFKLKIKNNISAD